MSLQPRTFDEMLPQESAESLDGMLSAADVVEALSRAGQLDASRVSVVEQRGNVTLDGFVATRSEVDIAGEVAGRVAGVRHVDNRLNVQPAIVS